MKKFLILSLIATATTFSSKLTVRAGYSFDALGKYQMTVTTPAPAASAPAAASSTTKTEEVTEKLFNYLTLNVDYTSALYQINDKMNINLTVGGEANIGLFKDGTLQSPMYYGGYINPSFDYQLNNDLSLRAGVKAGVGYSLVVKKDGSGKLTTYGEEATNPIRKTNTVGVVGVNLGVNYKNFDASLELGTKLINGDKIIPRLNCGLTLGYSFDVSEYGF